MGLRESGGGQGEDGGQAWNPHLPLWDLGFPSHPDPRAVLDLWSQGPGGCDFLREITRPSEQELRQVPQCSRGGEGRGGGQAGGEAVFPSPTPSPIEEPPPTPYSPAAMGGALLSRKGWGTINPPVPNSWHSGWDWGPGHQDRAPWRLNTFPRCSELKMALWEQTVGQNRGGSEGTGSSGGQGGWWAQGQTRGLTETQADQRCQKGQRQTPRKGQRRTALQRNKDRNTRTHRT